MSPVRPPFDIAGIGRPSIRTGAAQAAYARVERTLDRASLHQFHMGGADILFNSGMELERYILEGWKGCAAFEESLSRSIGASNPGAVAQYGGTAGAAFDAVRAALRNAETIWSADLYAPWWDRLAQDWGGGRSIDHTDILKRGQLATPRETLAASVAAEVVRRRPRVIYLPLVTQLGVRIPVEDILCRVLATWTSEAVRWLPVVVLDGCQAFGRVAIQLDAYPLREFATVFIGCFHKAVRGPKGLAFVLCADRSIARDLTRAFTASNGLGDSVTYARAMGGSAAGTTVGMSNVVVGGVLLDECSYEGVASRQPRLRYLEGELRGRTQRGWSVLNPQDEDQWSGIVSFRPPEYLKGLPEGSLRDRIADEPPGFAVDEVGGCLRVAIGMDHDEEDIADLASAMEAVARRQ